VDVPQPRRSVTYHLKRVCQEINRFTGVPCAILGLVCVTGICPGWLGVPCIPAAICTLVNAAIDDNPGPPENAFLELTLTPWGANCGPPRRETIPGPFTEPRTERKDFIFDCKPVYPIEQLEIHPPEATLVVGSRTGLTAEARTCEGPILACVTWRAAPANVVRIMPPSLGCTFAQLSWPVTPVEGIEPGTAEVTASRPEGISATARVTVLPFQGRWTGNRTVIFEDRQTGRRNRPDLRQDFECDQLGGLTSMFAPCLPVPNPEPFLGFQVTGNPNGEIIVREDPFGPFGSCSGTASFSGTTITGSCVSFSISETKATMTFSMSR